MSLALNNGKPLRSAIYARVSTEEQAEFGYSIDAQVDALTSHIRLLGNELVGTYVDAGVSGKSVKGRLELARMLQDAKDGKFDVVLVWKINRLARNQLDLLRIIDDLRACNVAFRSYSENFETETPMGRFALQMMGAVGELERNTIVENVRLGMKQRARDGKWNGGAVLGYRTESVPNASKRHPESRLIVVKDEADTVRLIFELYASGLGLKAIANRINKEGLRTKRGNMFSINGVRDILLNPVYIGKIRFNVREHWSELRRKGTNPDYILADGDHEPIISQELWDRVRAIHAAKEGKPKRSFTGTYPLTGLLRCPECGAGMVAGRSSQKRKDGTEWIRRYYVCGQFANKGSAACRANSVPADQAEKYVYERLSEVVTKKQILRDVVLNVNRERTGHIQVLQEELTQVDKMIQQATARKNKLFALFEEDKVSQDFIRERLVGLDEELTVLGDRKAELEAQIDSQDATPVPIEMVEAVLRDFSAALSACAPEQRKSLLVLVVKEITVKDRCVDKIVLTFDETIERNVRRWGDSNGEEASEGVDDDTLDRSLVVRFTL